MNKSPGRPAKAPVKDVRSKAAIAAGLRIRTLREGKGLTQRELGAAVDKTSATLCLWEAGRAAPDVAGWIKLALTLKTTPEYLAFGVVSESKK